jgi:uncharacterized protein (TIGR02679 family)
VTPAPPRAPAAPAWLRDPGLQPVWAAARERLERTGVQPHGTVVVSGLDRPGRHALSGLLGRPVVRGTARVDLATLDAVLRERSGVGGLVAVVSALGGPLRNRAAERSARDAAREAPYDAARVWLAEHRDVAGQPWVEDWLAAVRRSGLLARAPDPPAELVRALELSGRLLAGGPAAAPVARTGLAATATGDSHALDEGSVLAGLVLRALSVAAGTPLPASAAGRRRLWERHGVRPDLVSSTCLVLGLRPRGDGALARRLRQAADAGDPVHVTAWDLERDRLDVPAGTWVLVCENPRVLEAVAQRYAGRVGMVCTSGMPGLVVVELLTRLAGNGVDLAYHGDFDWPGIAIANRLAAQVGARPWRMGAADYLATARPDGPVLSGAPVLPSWDPGLGAAMSARGVGIHEEAVLEDLLAALDRETPPLTGP